MGSSHSKRHKHSSDSESRASHPSIVAHVAKSKENPVHKHDVMISYSHQDMEIMNSIKESLESSGLKVWVDQTGLTPGTSFLREIGEAIVDSLMFLVILSPDSVSSKFCQDEVSLAYISNKTIFSVAVKPFNELAPVMDLGMKLTLSGMQWHFIEPENNELEEQLAPLLSSIKASGEILTQQNEESESDLYSVSDGEDDTEFHNFVMNRQAFRGLNRQESVLSTADPEESEGDMADKQFWGTNFGKEKDVEWSKFQDLVDNKYKHLWKQMMVTEQQKNLLFHLMSKEMLVKEGRLNFKFHEKFCTRGGDSLPLSQAIRLFAAETYAMKEVFDVNSSVRLSAIGNLGKYQSKAVIDALLDLLERDDDPDVMVVAAISLAHAASGMKVFKKRSEKRSSRH